MQGSVKIEIDVGKADFSKAEQEVRRFARDTGKVLDPLKKQKLEMNVADATVKLQGLRQELKNFQGTLAQRKQLIIDTNNASSSLTEAKRKLQNFTNTGDENLSRLQQKFNGVGTSIKNMMGSFLSWTAIVLGIKQLGTAIISVTNALEQNQVAFTTMLGSEQEAKKLLKDLSAFAAKTPFTIPGIRDNAKQLLAMGVSSKNLIPTLKMLGDIASGLGIPLDRLSLAYGQILAKGRLQGGELKQLLEAGVPIVEALSKQLGVSTAEFYKMVEAGQISSVEVTKAMEAMTQEGGKFNDLMIKQSKTIGGLWSNLQDIITQVGEKIGTKLLPGMKNFVSAVLDSAEKYGDAIADVVADLVSTIGKILSEAGKGIAMIFNLLSGNTKKAVNEQVNALDAIYGVFVGFTNGLKIIVFAIRTVGKVIGDFFGILALNIQSGITSAVNASIKAINFLVKGVNLIPGVKIKEIGLLKNTKTAGVGNFMTQTFKEIGNDFVNLDIKSLKASKSIKDSFGAIGKIDLSQLNSAIKDTSDGVSKLDATTKNKMENIDEKIKDSKDKREDYQKEIEKTKEKIQELRDSAVKDIDDINRQLKDLQATGSSELAKRYAEVVKELAGSGLDDSERNKLLEEKLFLEGKVSEELRNQAIEYSKLSEGQKIYTDNQKEIAELQERQKIDQALLSGKLVQTATGVGIQDENDPAKIIAITNLKNQQYAQDLINKQTAYALDLQAQEQKAEDELAIYLKLSQDKLAIEQQYTKLFGDEIEKQKALVDSLIAKMNELARAKSKAGASNVGSSVTNNNQSNTFNVNNNTDVSSVVNTLNSKVR